MRLRMWNDREYTSRVTDSFDIFQQAVLADEALQAELDATIYPDSFLQRALQAAYGLGLDLSSDALRPRSRESLPQPGNGWAPNGWLPVALTGHAGRMAIDWARFGDVPVDTSFYADAVASASYRPFNRVIRHATTLDGFVAASPTQPTAPLAGLVFHMSRCGSTLVAQMLGGLEAAISLSEPGPLDAVVRYALARPDIPQERHVALMRAMVAALTRPRRGERRSFLKLDSWHILALPLFRAAFPSVPWIYLFRDPTEVLVSHLRMRGYQTVPDLVPAGLYGAVEEASSGPEAQCASILARYHGAAIEALANGDGIAIDYAELPAAFERRILPHFGLSLSDSERALVTARAAQDAKFLDSRFVPDGKAKQQEAGAAVSAAAARYLSACHAVLRAHAEQ
jgi:hypothetical protein